MLAETAKSRGLSIEKKIEFLESLTGKVIFLPFFCPFLMVFERTWIVILNTFFHDIDELISFVGHFLFVSGEQQKISEMDKRSIVDGTCSSLECGRN